jgi:hypothetical protein
LFSKSIRGKRRGAGLLHRRGWDALFKNYQPDSFHSRKIKKDLRTFFARKYSSTYVVKYNI